MNDEVPSLAALQKLIELGKMTNNPELCKSAEGLIKRYRLPYVVEDGIVITKEETTEAYLERFVTQDETMLQMKKDILILAKIQDEVLIAGPTGTGKELIARALHGNKDAPFIPINCAGIPITLMESLMFGHLKGSFTGADTTREGFLKDAKDGTFFLDEMGELSTELQGKLLRALQEKKIMKVGSTREEEIHCRIICATNRNLKHMVANDQFRKDLLARISTFEIDLTGLEERPKDIPLILSRIRAEGITPEDGKKFLEVIGGPEKAMCLDIPYNVRSLIQHVKRYKVLGKVPTLLNCLTLSDENELPQT